MTRQNFEEAAERGLLGGFMRFPDELRAQRDRLSSDHFYLSANQIIYGHILKLDDANLPFDDEALIHSLAKASDLTIVGGANDLTAVGGANHINALYDAVEVTAHMEAWLELVLEAYRLRLTKQAINDAVHRVKNDRSATSKSIAAGLTSFLADIEDEPGANGPTSLKPFPLDALPPIARSMVAASMRSNQTKATLPALAALGVVSAALGRVVATSPKSHHRSRANLFIVGSAESGSGKGETFNLFMRPLKRVETQWLDKHNLDRAYLRLELKELTTAAAANAKRTQQQSSRDSEALAEKRMDELQSRLQLGAPSLIADDMTAEKMETLLAANDGELFVASSEAKRIFENIAGRNNKSGSDDSDLWCKIWAGDPLNVQRMSRTLRVDNPCASMLAFVQPDLARSFKSSNEFYERGLLARILFADTFSTPTMIDPDKGISPINEAIVSQWELLVADTYNFAHAKLTPTLHFSDEAAREFIAIHNDMVAVFNGGIREGNALRTRRAQQAERIAIVLHAMAWGKDMGKHPINLETARAAVAIEGFFRQFQDRIIESRAGHKSDAYQVRAIAALKKNGEMTLNEIRVASGVRNKTKCLEMITVLLESGQIEEVTPFATSKARFKLKNEPKIP